MSTKILLVYPNIKILLPYSFPTDLGALSSYLKREGYETKIHIVNNLRGIGKLKQVLLDFNPDIVGFTAIYSQIQHVFEMAGIVKAWKNVPIIVGGKHATLVPDKVIWHQNVDAICVGEGELTFHEFIQAVESGSNFKGIGNLWYKQGDEVIKNPPRPYIQDLDSLPFWDFEAVDYQDIITRQMNTTLALAGRGICAWKCTFCGVPNQAKCGIGRFTRYRSVEHLLGEIEWLTKKYNFKYIYFRDDTFTLNRKWTMGFATEYPKHFKYPFEFLTRADCLDKELMDALKEAGCECIWLGADCGNDWLREEVLRKDIDNEVLIETALYLHKIGIKPLITNMIGLPYETPKMLMDTIELNRKIYGEFPSVSRFWGLCPAVFVFGPFPGSDLYEVCEKEGWIRNLPRDYNTYAESYIEMPQFSRKEIYKWWCKFRYLVYKDSHPGWAFWCFIKDHFRHYISPRFYPFEGLVRRFEYILSDRQGRKFWL